MKAKSDKFPLSVRRGSATVKIYRERKPSGDYFRVSFYKGTVRQGLNFSDLKAAKSEAEAKAAQLSRGDIEAMAVTGRDRLVYARALEAVRPLGVALDSAALEYSEAKIVLDGHSLTEAARFYMRHRGHGIHHKPVAEAVTEMITAKSEAGLSAAYLADLRYRLGLLAGAFVCNVNDIGADDLRGFFQSLSLKPRGFNNTVATVSTFFAFGEDRRWLAKGAGAELLAGVHKRKEKSVPVEIFTSAEMADVLAHCSAELKPCLGLAAFAGLRMEEILRLDWADVDRRPGFIEIAAHKAKTAARRLVPISNNLAAWLAVSSRGPGRLWRHSKPYFFESIRDTVNRINAARKPRAPRFLWKQNALRHSYASYRLAEISDTNRLALEMGNSAKMIFQHYRELATPAEAKTWFSLAPTGTGKVIAMGAAQ